MNTIVKLPKKLEDYLVKAYGVSEDAEDFINRTLKSFLDYGLSYSNVIINSTIVFMNVALAYNELRLNEAVNFILSLDGIDYKEILQAREMTMDEFKEGVEIYLSMSEEVRNGNIV